MLDGTANHHVLGGTVSVARLAEINTLYGSYDDSVATVIPVKIQRGMQIYDSANKILIQPKLSASSKGERAFWKDFHWERSAPEDMKSAGPPRSRRKSSNASRAAVEVKRPVFDAFRLVVAIHQTGCQFVEVELDIRVTFVPVRR